RGHRPQRRRARRRAHLPRHPRFDRIRAAAQSAVEGVGRAGQRLRRAAHEGHAMSKIKVLITDDSLFMRAAIKKLLAADGRLEVVREAKDGRDAVDKVQALKPDVCTMDFNMPRLDGAGAIREIMKTRPTPVVMLSAHTKQGARETFEALAAGAVDFLA